MYLRINELWSLSKAGAWPPEVWLCFWAPHCACTLSPVVAAAQEDSGRAGKRALAPSQQTAGTISDPVSCSRKTRLSSPCLEPPSHSCFEVSPFGFNLPLELVDQGSSLCVLRTGCQGLSPAPGWLCSALTWRPGARSRRGKSEHSRRPDRALTGPSFSSGQPCCPKA